MKFVTVRDLRSRSAEVWRDLEAERELVVTSNGRPVAILASVGDANLEQALAAFRQARAVQAVTALQRRSVEQGTDTLGADEMDEEIRAVRAARRR
jgi:antitoxin (DNA-binding transcriptional repressor) of toxin-antitoxin stability system